jgi:uncharacterized membrane protein YsdA (DUF1294 family)
VPRGDHRGCPKGRCWLGRFWGGTIGAYVGRALFRHKTRKQPFSSHLHQTAILQGFAVALVGGWMLAG